MLTPNPAIPSIPNTPELAMPLSFGPARPLVLFPVRLETRFFALADGGSELRVRVYPDSVHIDTHEPELTADELNWGRHFWEQTWRAAKDEVRGKTAWRQLADRYDPPRAAWIARTLQPLNPKDRPARPISADQPLPKTPRFPSPATHAETWTRAPAARLLPNQWFVLGYKNDRLVVNVKGGVISDKLATGPDPLPTASVDPLGIDAGMEWLVNFDAAEKVGMGIRAKLTKEEATEGLDFVLVMGVKDSLGRSTDWTPRLAEMLDAHHFTGGLSFVPEGTPSNNTADAPSGFSSKDPGQEASYLADRMGRAFKPGDGSNADVLTRALGLAKAGPVLADLPHATAKEQLDARHMNTALWQATWGYFLVQMLGVGAANESPLTDDDIAWIRSHFVDYVRPSGPLPALRIGKQPYGILPVTSLSAWQAPADRLDQSARDVALRDFLIRLRDLWRRNVPEVPRLGRTEDLDLEKGIDKDLAEVLSMDGRSSSYSLRHLMGRHYLEHLWVYLSAEHFSDVWGAAVEEPPPEPEAPDDMEPPPDLSPMERVAFIRSREQLRIAFARAHARWAAMTEARRQRVALIKAKRDSASAWSALHDQRTGALLQTLGVTWTPRMAHGVFAPRVANLTGALVQEGPVAERSLLAPNYIQALLAARNLDAIRHQSLLQPPPRALLYLLLRHSMLLEYTTAASGLLIRRGLLPPALRREPELVDLPLGPAMLTVWRQMVTKISVPGVQDPLELGKFLLGFKPSGEPDVRREPELKTLSDFRASLAHLESLAPARLEQLMTGTLDTCSYRLDAWITSLATKRLAEMRKAKPAGVLFGGYGWVMNLQPAAAPTAVAPPPGESEPVFQSPNNPGFVHAPSLAQATTAAVLRSGHLAHSGQQVPNDLLAIDLSSERVRLAAWLLDGVRQGQPLAALLGYRFERRLQEAKKQQFISYFRELSPLVGRKLEATDQPVEAVAANNVADGLGLQKRWLSVRKSPTALDDLFGSLQSKPSPADLAGAKTVLEAELDALADSVDAVSDALMAESVYQVVRGNPVRAAMTVESIAGGETPPPELEVARTPRSGIALTHRLVALFSGDPKLPSEWSSSKDSHRANAEPHLNAWAARLLGSPARVRCSVERLEPTSGKLLETKEVRLDELRLSPLDFIYAAEGGEGGQQAEIEQRILHTIMRKPNGFAPGSLLRIDSRRRPEWTADELGYGEFSELLRTARKLISGARGIGADDLNPPDRTVDAGIKVAELKKRADASERELRRTTKEFEQQLKSPDRAKLEKLRHLISSSAGFGVPGAVPLSAGGDTSAERQILLAQAGSIRKELERRVAQLTALAHGFNATKATVEQRCDHMVARLRLVFGKSFVVLSRFTPANGAELAKALADSAKVQGGDPTVSTTWFHRMAHVRDGAARLHASLHYSEALNTGEKLKLTIAQLPYDARDRWVGLPLQAGKSLPGGKLSLAVQSAGPINVRKALAGVLIDEWVEVVPSSKETTGLSFQYDRPNAAPPQTILVAVPPQLESPWTVWSLQQVLLETLDLARIRAVDPDALDEVGHYLPALYLACNTANHTVSTDFATIK